MGQGGEFFKAASAHHVEGVVSKPLNAPYRPGDRRLWQKAKCLNREEFVVVGFTDPDGARAYFGALLLGYHDEDGRLLFAGRAGTGFSDVELRRVHAKLKPLVVRKMPLAVMPPRGGRAGFGKPLDFRKVHWVRPKLVCEVSYLTWTADGLLRAVSYEGLREDKNAKEVGRPARTVEAL